MADDGGLSGVKVVHLMPLSRIFVGVAANIPSAHATPLLRLIPRLLVGKLVISTGAHQDRRTVAPGLVPA